MAKDWYRQTQWNDRIRAHFHEKLARAKASSRSQYLCIQAGHLVEKSQNEAAIELLELLIDQYPVRLHLISAYLLRAKALEELGRAAETLGALRNAVEAQKAMPNVHSGAFLEFAAFVIRKDLHESFTEAAEALEVHREMGHSMLPVEKFREMAYGRFYSRDLESRWRQPPMHGWLLSNPTRGIRALEAHPEWAWSSKTSHSY